MAEDKQQEPTQDGEQEQPAATFTQADLDRIIKERLERERTRYADYNDLKKAAEELEKLKDAELSEVERLGKEKEQLEAKMAEQAKAAEAREQEHQAMLVRAEVRVSAAALGFQNPNDAYALADLSSVTVEKGEVQGVENALKALAKDKPYLLDAVDGGAGTPPRKTRTAPKRAPEFDIPVRW